MTELPHDVSGTAPDRAPRRVRHELRRRLLTVVAVETLGSHMRRVTLGGADLDGFASPGFDDHVKIFFPDPGQDAPVLPQAGRDGRVAEDAPRPVMRDFTPRLYDPVERTLAIDFALHEDGPASDWARQAKPGQALGVGGPRGSMLLAMDFDGYLLIGDDTALPAIGRRLSELPQGAPVVVLAEVDGPEDELAFKTLAAATIHWIHRGNRQAGTADGFLHALAQANLPGGDIHAWIACESDVAKQLRRTLIADHGANPKWIKAAGYWRRGAVAVHENHED
jgi:NADPH-dependent ferric siderophore reductase